jgi:hypothetical protein
MKFSYSVFKVRKIGLELVKISFGAEKEERGRAEPCG